MSMFFVTFFFFLKYLQSNSLNKNMLLTTSVHTSLLLNISWHCVQYLTSYVHFLHFIGRHMNKKKIQNAQSTSGKKSLSQ